MKHKQRETVNEKKKKKSIQAVCRDRRWRARESSAVGVWAEEWGAGESETLGAQSRVLIRRWRVTF